MTDTIEGPENQTPAKMNDLSCVSSVSRPAFALVKKEIPLDAILIVGVFLLICIVEFLSIFLLNDGKFIYTLDDPYIHLAVAEEIARGHYGINGLEFAAPSSSFVWPLLLAPLARTAVGEFFPLVLNLGFGVLTCLVVLRGVRRVLPSEGGSTGLGLPLARVVMAWVVLLGCNVVGLVFTGMEHSLQVLLAILVTDGLIQFARTGKTERLFVMAVICGPWVRYENLALTAVACAVLFFKKLPIHALVIGFSALVGLAAFSGFLMSLGLSPIPSSILAKSYLAGDASGLGRVLQALPPRLLGDRGVLLLMMSSALAWHAARPGCANTRPAAVGLAAAGLLHACFGAYGWYHRYECYIFGALLYGICTLVADPSGRNVGRWVHAHTALLALFGLMISYPYIADLFTVPVAANNIYEQQYQMHRFVTEWWKKPVAVNDLGWVSYRNDAYVLDLWGLGSHEALRARTEGRDPSWMSSMAQEHGVGLAMVYENWVPASAAGWIKVGELRLSRARITPAGAVVTFFATSPASVEDIERALQNFRTTLPPGVVLVTSASKS
jgi:hypothetical protein